MQYGVPILDEAAQVGRTLEATSRLLHKRRAVGQKSRAKVRQTHQHDWSVCPNPPCRQHRTQLEKFGTHLGEIATTMRATA